MKDVSMKDVSKKSAETAGFSVRVDLTRCEGNAICVGVAPEVFELTDNDELILLDSNPAASLHEAVRSAARQCPRQAITIEDQP